MWQFRKCMEENDLSVLVVEGEAGPEQLAEAWTNLFYEYCDLAEAHETKYRTRLQAEIQLEEKKCSIVQGWIDILAVCYRENIAEAIRTVGFDYELNPEDPAQYLADLTRISSELSTARLHVRIKKAEMQAILENQSTIDDNIDVKFFDTMYFRINHYAKYNAVSNMSYVSDYCAALRDAAGASSKTQS